MFVPFFDSQNPTEVREGDFLIQCFTMAEIFQFKMPGFLKATLSVANAQALLARFQPVSINEVKAPDAKFPRLYRVRAVILYVAQPTKKIKYSKQTKSMGQGLRRVEVEKYHRYIVFGLPNSSSVVGMFTTNSEQSRCLLRYAAVLRPGSQVEIIRPSIEGQMSTGNTTLITTLEPLVPTLSEDVQNGTTLPPYDVEGSNLNYCFFNFVTQNLTIDSALVSELVCGGSLCDAQTYHESCPCLEAAQEKCWVLLFQVQCPELNENVNNDEKIHLYSRNTSSFFLTDQIRAQNADSDVVDRFELDMAVQDLVADINQTQGFRVIGWFKPAFDDEGTAIEHKKFHICSLEPATPMTAAQMAMRYNGSGMELPSVFSTSEEEGLSNGDGLGPGETQGEDL